jgi:preprotein translocase subunit YajC
MSLISSAYAQVVQTGASSGDNPLMSLIPLILIFAVFYVLIIRPQQKKIKEHEAILGTMKRGDDVVTGGGIIGKVSKIEEDSNIVHIEIAKDVVVRVNKATIIEILSGEVSETASAKRSAKRKSDKK